MRRSLLPATALTTVLLLAAPLTGAATASPTAPDGHDPADSLPRVDRGQPPGPDVLYAPRPEAPQLANHDPRFRADPLMVSGTEAYVDGEYLYQDHLYDDFGADTDGGASNAPVVGDGHAGNLSYPTNRERYADNAADLVEVRIAPSDDEVAYRITLNTLLEPDSTIVAIAFDTDGDEGTGTDTLPRDPGAPFPGTDEVITAWGTGAEHTSFDAGGDEVDTTDVDIQADLDAAQLTVTVPREVSDPRGTWRTTVATGLLDPDTGGWLLPGSSADDETPGGASATEPDPPGIFNLAFRFDEPIAEEAAPPDVAQAEALADGEPTRYAHGIDFDELAAGGSRTTVPASGTMVRLLPSRLDVGEGQDRDAFPGFLGRLQPYSVYVPSGYDPADPPGLTLNLHSLGQYHWQYNGSTGVEQLGEERGDIVATPLARGPDGWYQREAEYDVFEVWNDLAHHYVLDADRVALTGYSMGGYGTYRLGTRYPDLFGAALTIVGPPGDGIWVPPNAPTGGAETLTNIWLENARNVPFMNVAAAADELVPVIGPTAQNTGAGAGIGGVLPDVGDELAQLDEQAGFQSLEERGYRYRYRLYPSAEHFSLALLSYDLPGGAEFLGEAEVDRDPPHVTFAAVPDADDPDRGLVADHAYWVSGIELADPDADAVSKGVVDAFSHGSGLGDPEVERHTDAGVEPAPLSFTEVGLDWTERERIEPANLLEVGLDNVASATVDVVRGALDPERELTVEVSADADGALHLDGSFPEETVVERDGEELDEVDAGPDGARLPVVAGEQTFVLSGGEADGAPGQHGRDVADERAGDRGQQGRDRAEVRGAALPATGGGLGLLTLAMLGLGLALRRRG